MKKIISVFAIVSLILVFIGCDEENYQDKEYYKQEVYILNNLSTSSKTRSILNVDAYTYVDTLKVISVDYDTEFVKVTNDTVYTLNFKVGIGGSLPAHEDVTVKLTWDTVLLEEANILGNSDLVLPDASLWTTNVDFDPVTKEFEVIIPKGRSVTALNINLKIIRDEKDLYKNYAFPLKVVSSNHPINKLYDNYLVSNFTISETQMTNFSGFDLPPIKMGRYHSPLLSGNAENTGTDGERLSDKFILPLGDAAEYEGKYMVFGWAIWSWEKFGFFSLGWMYTQLNLIDENSGQYELVPVIQGDALFPARTFNHSTQPETTEDNFYDPFTKELKIVHRNAIGSEYIEILKYKNDDMTLKATGLPSGGKNWEILRSKGYQYWLPIASENE